MGWAQGPLGPLGHLARVGILTLSHSPGEESEAPIPSHLLGLAQPGLGHTLASAQQDPAKATQPGLGVSAWPLWEATGEHQSKRPVGTPYSSPQLG